MKIKDYDYDRWTALRVFPQYRELEEEYNKLSLAYEKECSKSARLQRRVNVLNKLIKKGINENEK